MGDTKDFFFYTGTMEQILLQVLSPTGISPGDGICPDGCTGKRGMKWILFFPFVSLSKIVFYFIKEWIYEKETKQPYRLAIQNNQHASPTPGRDRNHPEALPDSPRAAIDDTLQQGRNRSLGLAPNMLQEHSRLWIWCRCPSRSTTCYGRPESDHELWL